MAERARTAAAPRLAAAGTCFGFAVHSPLPFAYLRAGTGDALTITEGHVDVPPAGEPPLFAWNPTPARPFHARLFGTAGRYRYWVDGTGWFRIDAVTGTLRVPPSSDPVRREERIWGVPALLCYAARGDVPLHAAAVEVGGGAVILAAPGRHGKTTLAAAFLNAGYRVLAEDMSCCRPGAEPTLVPGPAMLRLRQDVARRLHVAGTQRVAEDDDRVHLAHDPGMRGDGRPVPLRALLLLRPGADACRLSRVDPAAVLPDLWALSFILPGEHDPARRFRALTDLADRVPAWNLARPDGIGRLPEVVETIVANVGCSGGDKLLRDRRP